MRRKYRKVGENGERVLIFPEVENFYTERDNLHKNTVFSTVNLALPTIQKMNDSSLNVSDFFNRFESSDFGTYVNPKRSKTPPRERFVMKNLQLANHHLVDAFLFIHVFLIR